MEFYKIKSHQTKMIGTIIKNPGRTLAFLTGGFVGSQVPYFPVSYQTYIEIKKEQSELLIDKYQEILEKRSNVDIQELRQEERSTLHSLNSRLKSLENSSLLGKLGTIALDPKGAWGTIKHYHSGFDLNNLKETAGYGFGVALLALGVYEFFIRRPIKRVFSRNKPKK